MSKFTIYPAVDLKAGKCVRLLQGRADAVTVYGNDPIAMAQHWAELGAKWIHVVDLDGAFGGQPAQTELILKIAKSVRAHVQCGGGLRSDEDIQRLLDGGVARVVLGTRAWADAEQLDDLSQKFGEKLAVGIDSRDGMVQIKGWTQTTNIRASALARKADLSGIRTIIVTDTATDGMLTGANANAIEDVCTAVKCHVIASGGVATVTDVRNLRRLGQSNLVGVIVGKALYEGRVTLPELQSA
jgi:phosphoribosylformimino-5-aminoimidazole carboxamide ribotide isomerase